MKPLVALFKKKSIKLYLFFKAISQEKGYIINTVACCLHKRKEIRKTVKIKIGRSFLELICFIFYTSFLGCAFLLSVFYLCFVRSSHWEVFVN